MADFGTALRRRRKLLGLTQRELASMAGCTHVFVVNAEQSRTGLTLGKLLDLLKVLGLGLSLEPGNGTITVTPELGE